MYLLQLPRVGDHLYNHDVDLDVWPSAVGCLWVVGGGYSLVHSLFLIVQSIGRSIWDLVFRSWPGIGEGRGRGASGGNGSYRIALDSDRDGSWDLMSFTSFHVLACLIRLLCFMCYVSCLSFTQCPLRFSPVAIVGVVSVTCLSFHAASCTSASTSAVLSISYLAISS